jgi:hypothetical protein
MTLAKHSGHYQKRQKIDILRHTPSRGLFASTPPPLLQTADLSANPVWGMGRAMGLAGGVPGKAGVNERKHSIQMASIL